MKKRILSCLMALALCLTLLPTAALAEETEGTAQTSPAVEESTDPANGEAKQESQPAAPEQENQPAEAKREGQSAEQEEQQEDSAAKQAVANVQAMIDDLPDAAELDGMDDTARESACLAASEAYEAYDALTEDQQSALTGAEKMIAILEWTTEQVALAAGTGETHEHYLCGGTDCNQEGHALEDEMTTFEPWTVSATTTGGAYYLTSDIGGFTVPSGVNLTLCLNGYNITSNGAQNEDVITVKPGATFTLCDCKRGDTTDYGTIGHRRPDQYNGSGVTVENGTFNMYGGKIANNTVGYFTTNKSNGYGGGVLVFNKGIFNMIGGEITGNRAKYGGGVSVGTAYGLHDNTAEDIGGTFNMTGGKISGNFCASNGGGVYACASSKLYFTVSGTAEVMDNYTGNLFSSSPVEGTANNVYLEKYTGGGVTTTATINVEGTLTGNIGVTTAEEGQTVAKGVSEAAAERFNSDSSKYRLIYDSGERTLTMATAAHSAHPICGETCMHDGEHTAIENWQSVSKLSDISKAGNYYLTQNVEITSTWKPVNGVVLCLNGYDITANGDFDAITIEGSRTFTLCDCFGGGKITHGLDTNNPAYRRSGSGVAVENKGTFIMYGGSITGNEAAWSYDGGGVNVQSGGVFEMHGGTITNNVAYLADGGGVYVGGTFTMTGGEITGNTATVSKHPGSGQGHGYGGGVYVYDTGTVNISGSAKIYDNKHGEGTSASGGINHVTNNVCLPSGKAIQIVGELDAAASIGVTSTETLSATEPVTVATLAEGVTYTPGSIFSDLGEPSGVLLEGGNLNLYGARPHKHPICGETCEDGANHGEQTWTPVSSLDEITKEGNYYLTQSVEIDTTWQPVNGVVLCLNGNYIEMTNDGDVITVNNGVKFTLTNCMDQGAVMHSGSRVNGHGVVIRAGGTFSLYNAKICDNQSGDASNDSVGAGVYVNGGTFQMYSGSIRENTALRNGGGVYVDGDTGKFTMSGGTIEGNTSSGENYGDGGGVYINGGTFTMTGGSITNNISRNAGGVCVGECHRLYRVRQGEHYRQHQQQEEQRGQRRVSVHRQVHHGRWEAGQHGQDRRDLRGGRHRHVCHRRHRRGGQLHGGQFHRQRGRGSLHQGGAGH